jgi:hypothetical protein
VTAPAATVNQLLCRSLEIRCLCETVVELKIKTEATEND